MYSIHSSCRELVLYSTTCMMRSQLAPPCTSIQFVLLSIYAVSHAAIEDFALTYPSRRRPKYLLQKNSPPRYRHILPSACFLLQSVRRLGLQNMPSMKPATLNCEIPNTSTTAKHKRRRCFILRNIPNPLFHLISFRSLPLASSFSLACFP